MKFLINDYFILAAKIKVDGCHMGQLDGSIKLAKKLKGKILGITCHNSKRLARRQLRIKQIILLLDRFLNLNLNQMQKKQILKF